MPNVFQNTSLVTNEFMFQLKNQLPFFIGCNSDYRDRFTDVMKVGESIKVRKPPIYSVRSGETFTPGDMADQYCTMTVQQTQGVDLVLTNREQMFNFTSLRDQVIKPAATALANKIESLALQYATLATYNVVGTPGTIPTSLETYNQARAIMFNNSAPMDDMNRLIISADMGVKTNAAGQSLFHPATIVAKSWEKGYITSHAGADIFESQLVYSLTTGAYGGVPTATSSTDGVAGTDTSIITTAGWTTSAGPRVRAGDTLQIAGVFEINRETKQSTGRLKSFVVTANASGDVGGAATITVSPKIVTTGNYQNVSAAITAGALISIYGAAAAGQAALSGKPSPQGLRYHRNAFLACSFDQPLPTGGVVRASMKSDDQTSLRVRFIEDWDTDNNQAQYRFDVVWAWGIAYAELACRIAS